MVSLAERPKGASKRPDAVSVRYIWSYVLGKVMRQGGPFGGVYKTEVFENTVEAAVRLFPDGIPERSKKWVIPQGVALAEYGAFLKKVFTRTVPTPISD